ncbi:DUF2167 domain-containing protein [Archangium violaceum]|uniref:DUF2167 domain-containing protein n=1 Tax=Archangium violaceum TaxID=83451 RepID=UPI002B2AD462|nr:DUF2167 domain-containing protein [Archangium violaceum]
MKIQTWVAAMLTTCLLGAPVAFAQSGAGGEAPAAHNAGTEETGPQVNWTRGPAHVELGRDIAQIELPEGYSFVGPEDARNILRSMGNRPSGSELGLLVPNAEDQDWFMVFSWQAVGYVKDDEKDKIDADALLENIQEATEDGNSWRKENNIPALHVTGWAEPPRYDERTNNLVWATIAESEGGGKSVNYNMRLLGRRGLVSAVLVEDPELLAKSKPFAYAAMDKFSFKPGSMYSEWQQGDKVAEYGLTALVAAGAGATAAKLGFFGFLAKLFAKGGKALVAGVVAIFAAISKVWGSIRGKSSESDSGPQQP